MISTTGVIYLSNYPLNLNNDLFRWYLNGRKIKRDSAGTKYQIKGDRLTIQSVSTTDNGVYACEVENTFGIQRSSTHFVLNVRRKITMCLHIMYTISINTTATVNTPTIIHVPEDTIAAVGHSASFQCTYDASTATDVEWTKVPQNLKEANQKLVESRCAEIILFIRTINSSCIDSQHTPTVH
jgi:hypothetical protein